MSPRGSSRFLRRGRGKGSRGKALPLHVGTSHIHHAEGEDVDRPEVAGVFQPVNHFAVAVGKENLSGPDRVVEEVVDDPVTDPGTRHVKPIFRIVGLIGAHRVSCTDRCLRPVSDQCRRPSVCEKTVGLPVVQLKRVPVVEFVEDVPQINILGDLRHQILQMAKEKNDVFPEKRPANFQNKQTVFYFKIKAICSCSSRYRRINSKRNAGV